MFTACDKKITIDDVDTIKKVTHANQFFQSQYLSLSDSISDTELLEITKQIRERDERGGSETIYNYYLKNNPDRRFAVINGYSGGRSSHDTLKLIQYSHNQELEHERALRQIQKFKDEKKYVVSDSCYGIWRNWSNPFVFYLILYKKDNTYIVETFIPDYEMGLRKYTVSREENLIYGIVLVNETQQYDGFVLRKEKNTYRYSLNEFGDITWLDQYGKGEEFVQGVYNYLCGCDHQQDLSDLRAK